MDENIVLIFGFCALFYFWATLLSEKGAAEINIQCSFLDHK